MPIRQVQGNILDAPENIIVQSVNFQGVMGAGLAKQIATRYPKINQYNSEYQKIIREYTYEEIRRTGLFAIYSINDSKFIASIYGQNRYGRDKQYTDYIALGIGLDSVRRYADYINYSVAIPSGIGCGLGGGDWDVVLNIIETTFSYSQKLPVTIYIRNGDVS